MKELGNVAELSAHVCHAAEPHTLRSLRSESNASCAAMRQAVAQLEGFLKVGGESGRFCLFET